ncbi:CAP domain-containing protein [Patescibacteria group bacterium]|nr:CAP domain-containing protein [Patescibacteria group bacterium]MCG2702656.1 CAP domain-containing protein [Candidatus Parcubacteria bacterium]MBU4210543.1 CAP domain-containing protein [Patescibacteria group bacterium]MBU4264865.1 CAP domain-containing protein [Patescibacteria group bacterium]MBU4389736.1 CAP domain-containing protein [Patescibacteria group bacterium]
MKQKLSLLFIPQEKNNYKSLLTHPSFLGIFIAVYLLNQSLIRSFTILKPGVLGYSSEITVQKVIKLTNQERQKNGLPQLVYNQDLASSATNKAKDMFAYNYWAHNSPSGKTPWDFFKEIGYDYSTAGENLAKDFYDTDSMVKAWMKSPTHRDNILHAKYKEIGIGVVNGTLNGVKTTLVVQHFGLPLNLASVSNQQNPPNDLNSESPVLTETQQILSQENSAPLISPLQISKTLGIIMFTILILAMLTDGYITMKNKTKRLAGSATGHISFLAIILMLLLFSQQGSIF